MTYIVWVMDFNSDFVEKYTNSRYEGYAIRAVYVLSNQRFDSIDDSKWGARQSERPT